MLQIVEFILLKIRFLISTMFMYVFIYYYYNQIIKLDYRIQYLMFIYSHISLDGGIFNLLRQNYPF
jgi:hypothetical protein